MTPTSPAFAEAYAEALGGAEMRIVPKAGHWPWIRRPGVVTRVTDAVR